MRTVQQMKQHLEDNRNITFKGCWLWKGQKSTKRRNICFEGKYWLAHRLAFYLYKFDEFKEEAVICHTCNIGHCFNPEHLYAGSTSSNAQDTVKAGSHFQAGKITCKHGHEFTEENTKIRKDDSRECLACTKNRSIVYSVNRTNRVN